MARCLRCKAGNEWIEGNVRLAPKDGISIALTDKQATFLWAILSTHSRVCESASATVCAAIAKKIERARVDRTGVKP